MDEGSSRTHGLEGLLLAITGKKCPVQFDSPVFSFIHKHGYYIFKIKDGLTTRTYSQTCPEKETMDFDSIVEINGRDVTGDVNEATFSKMMRISDFIAQMVSQFYSSMVTNLKLSFGLSNGRLFLLDTSTVDTVDADSDFFAVQPEQESESLNNDSQSDDTSETETAQKKLKQKVADRIKLELKNFPRSRKVCCTNASSCGPPRYKVKKIIVVLFRLESEFPRFGEKELWSMILRQMPNPEQEVVCCVQCYHCYHAADVIHLCAEMPQLSFELPPRPFQPLVPAERSAMKKMPIGAVAKDSYAPHSYVLNIVNSPYNDTTFHGLVPLPPPSRRSRAAKTAAAGRQKRVSKERESVQRTKTAKSTRRAKTSEYDPGWEMYMAAPVVKMPTFETAKPASQAFAKLCYAECPFNYRIFENPGRMRRPGSLLAKKKRPNL